MNQEDALIEVVTKICGKSAAIIIPILSKNDNIDEFKIANKANMTINELRNILYKLHHNDLVTFTRKKDHKKGWFIYHWTLNKERALRSLVREYEKELEKHKQNLASRAKKNYFICPRGHTELNEESALEQHFECVECGDLLVLRDREEEAKKIMKSIESLEQKIAELNELLKKYVKVYVPEVKKRKVRVAKIKTVKVKKKQKVKKKKPKPKPKKRSKIKKARKLRARVKRVKDEKAQRRARKKSKFKGKVKAKVRWKIKVRKRIKKKIIKRAKKKR